MFILGIETSCDETSCAVLKNYSVLSNVTVSSLNQHKKYGGVIPEIAVREHLKNIDSVLSASLKASGVSLSRIGLVAVTAKPGLSGALAVGVNFAKALCLASGKELIAVNHLHAHLFAPFLNSANKFKFPMLGLVASGGHTEIYRLSGFDSLRLIGSTRDDACGEVYDKIARYLNLGYPGGPVVDRLFDPDYKNRFKLRCGRIGCDLSFSGIKTGVIYKKNEIEKQGCFGKEELIGLVSSFQDSVVGAIIDALTEAAIKNKIYTVACGGGVTANKYLRARLLEKEKEGFRIFMPPVEYSTDNAAMVAGLGFYLYNKRKLTRVANSY